MKIFSRQLLAATLVLGTAVTAATPALAVVETFATFSAATSARNLRFVNTGNSSVRTTDATVYTTATGTSNSPGAVAVTFSFLQPALAPFVSDVSALYTLNGTISRGSPVAGSGLFVQSNYSGTFSFITTSAITISGPGYITTTYAAGSNLLSGSFSDGTIVGNIGGTSGSSFASGPAGATVSFTSDFLDFSGVVSLDRAISLTAVTAAFGKHAGSNGALNSFRAVVGGQFSSDPAPVINAVAPVPDAQTWAMLVMGFGLVGVSVRRRRQHVAA